MKGIIGVTVRLIRAGRRMYSRKWSFLWLFAVMFFSTVAILGQLDVLPEKSPTAVVPTVTSTTNRSDTAGAVTLSPAIPELPMRIEISEINLSATIASPTTTSIEALDKELLSGAVHYPTSAKLGEIGNVVLFGHSSYLPVVHNQAYKTFNGIQKLVAGDVITVYSSGTEYTYRVRSVAKENASVAGIPLSVTGKVLTLATCNSFGAKEDRFIVTADFVESHLTSS